VLKAFTTGVAGQQLDVLIAGDDDDAKRKVSRLVSDAGLRPIDVGAAPACRAA
jgi:predicted dinucleotide-binding enzyme